MYNRNAEMSLDQIARVAPSVFAMTPWEGMSEKYLFVPTAKVVAGLMDNGFRPVHAAQSLSRIEGKGAYTKHVLRFRHGDFLSDADVKAALNQGREVPEIVLTNSHDGTSAYQIDLGFFRFACSNKMIVSCDNMETIRVRHSGKEDMVGQIIDASYRIIEDAPKAAAQIEQWKGLQLSTEEKTIFAQSALEVRDSALDVSPSAVLMPRRFDDKGNDLWRTFNTVQENLTQGGARGRTATGRRSSLRAVKSVDGDTKLNRALWNLAAKMAELKVAA